MICRMNFIHCEFANSNGYCCLSACCNPNIVGNTIKNEEPKVYSQQYVDELKAKYGWHTGTPTEDGWYLCKSEHMIGYDVGYYANGRFNRLHCFNQDDITEWKNIEP